MKRNLLIIIFLSAIQFSEGQVIELDGQKFNCDSAYTNYELSACANYIEEQSIHQYKVTLKAVLQCLDTLIAEDKVDKAEMLKEDSTQTFDNWSDYIKIKKMLEESIRLFEQHAQLEKEITGEFFGFGRERYIAENLRLAGLYDQRTDDLKQLLELYCN